MIYAIAYKKPHPQGFEFDTKSGAKAENAMYTLGYGAKEFFFISKRIKNYVVSSKVRGLLKPKFFITYRRVRILDKYGHHISIKN